MPLTSAQYDLLAEQLLLFLGIGDDDQAADQSKSAVYLVTQLAKSYTRGNGFGDEWVAEDIQAVIITASARLMTNPQQSTSESESTPLLRLSVGGGHVMPGEEGVVAAQSFAFSGGFSGWTDVKLAVLHAYRVRNG
jgi:hypothetical protein